MLKVPIILINFKLYDEGSGERAVALAKMVEKVARETGVTMGVCVQALDVRAVASAVKIPVFGQDFSGYKSGACTGAVSPLRLQEAGAVGSLINHSECKRPVDEIEKALAVARQLNFMTVCCAKTPEDGAELLKFQPDFVAVEPPELIGGDISVSKAQPDVIARAVAMIGGDRLLVGAGVKDGQDLKIALELGASGVLLASGVVKAADPEAVLRDLVSGIG